MVGAAQRRRPAGDRPRPRRLLQKLEQGDELLDLTQFGLPRPLPKEDRAAVSRWFAEAADAAMEAMGPRPGTGERAC